LGDELQLRRELASPAQRGMLVMLTDVSRRRLRLHRELRQYWTELEVEDFRGALISIVAKAASRQNALVAPLLHVEETVVEAEAPLAAGADAPASPETLEGPA
jgi:hypothetical protein